MRLFTRIRRAPEAILQRAQSALQDGQFDEAANLVAPILASEPDNAEAHFIRGTARLDGGHPEDALPDLTRAAVLKPEDGRYHYNLAVAHFRLDHYTEALCSARDALRCSPGFEPAARLQANIPLYGERYRSVLQRIHQHLKPRTYVEIGVFRGGSLSRVESMTRVVGIDPDHQAAITGPNVSFFCETSDEFFARHDLIAELGGLPMDLAFIDGMHQFEFVLRDFANLERSAHAGSIILIHDTFPIAEELTQRTFRKDGWTGDVWRAVFALKKYRPDLAIDTIVTAPSGLTVVRNLDPKSRILSNHMDKLCEEYIQVSYQESADLLGASLNFFPNEWELIKPLLGVSFDVVTSDKLV